MANVLSDRFVGDLNRVVQQLRQQTEDQRAQQGWPGPDPVRPITVYNWAFWASVLGDTSGTNFTITFDSQYFDAAAFAFTSPGSTINILYPGNYLVIARMRVGAYSTVAWSSGDVVFGFHWSFTLNLNGSAWQSVTGWCPQTVNGVYTGDTSGGATIYRNFNFGDTLGDSGGESTMLGVFNVATASPDSPATVDFTATIPNANWSPFDVLILRLT
jgi:hypothetical protein